MNRVHESVKLLKYHRVSQSITRNELFLSDRTNSCNKTRDIWKQISNRLITWSFSLSFPFFFSSHATLLQITRHERSSRLKLLETTFVHDAHWPVGRSSRMREAAATVACRVLRNTERRVPLSCFTEVSCRTDGSRRWRIDFIQRCVPRCSMNAALKASTFVCHLTTPRFRSRLLPVLAFAILPPPFFCFSSFIPFFLSFFFYPFFSVFLLLSLSFCLSSFFESFSLSLSVSLHRYATESKVKRVETAKEIGELFKRNGILRAWLTFVFFKSIYVIAIEKPF